jgi:hypothetical protein
MMDLNQATLFQLLTGFFGRDRVIYNMSALAACNGEIPINFTTAGSEVAESGFQVKQWAKEQPCLFTIVDENDDPKMVVEISDEDNPIDENGLLRDLLESAGVLFFIISPTEIKALADSNGDNNLCSWLTLKLDH